MSDNITHRTTQHTQNFGGTVRETSYITLIKGINILSHLTEAQRAVSAAQANEYLEEQTKQQLDRLVNEQHEIVDTMNSRLAKIADEIKNTAHTIDEPSAAKVETTVEE